MPEFSKFNGYLNIDTGTGRLRGAVGLRPARRRRRSLAGILAPFKDLKIGGATASASRAHRRHRQHVVQQRRPAGHRVQPGWHRVRQPHAPHQSRYLRARDRSRTCATPPSSSPARSTSWRCTTSPAALRADKMPRYRPSAAAATASTRVCHGPTRISTVWLCSSVFVLAVQCISVEDRMPQTDREADQD